MFDKQFSNLFNFLSFCKVKQYIRDANVIMSSSSVLQVVDFSGPFKPISEN